MISTDLGLDSSSDFGRALLGLTAQIVAAHVKRNTVPAHELPALIRLVHDALATAGAPPQVEPEKPVQPAAPKRTIFPDYIVCLEDGRKLKTLKRHLRTTYNMSPEEYREKWGLPADYPMVAPNYAARRSSLAKSLGLGRKTAKAVEDAAPALPFEPVEEPLPATAPRYTIAPAAAPVASAQQAREPRHEPTLDSVFSRFPKGANPANDELPEGPPPAAPEHAPEPAARKNQRKPFSKQLARNMRP